MPRRSTSPHRSDDLAFGLAFGRYVRKLRKARGLSQETVADRADLAVETVSRIERAEFSPSLDTLRKLARGIGVDLTTLFAATDSEPDQAHELATKARTLSQPDLTAAIRVLTAVTDVLEVLRKQDGEA